MRLRFLAQRQIITLAISIFFICFSTFSLAQSRSSDRPRLVVVEALNFEFESTLIEAVGTAQAKRSVTLFPSVSDEVTALNFVPGQFVKEGQVLVALDSRLQDVDIQRAKIELMDAQRNLERAKKSAARGALTERELDDANTLVLLAEVDLMEAKENKEDRLVRAPFDGTVGFTEVELGDRINPQTEISTIDDRRQLFVNFVAPELAVRHLLKKPDVTLEPWTDRGTTLIGKIAEVDSRVNTQNRTIRVRALLDNTDDQYRPGMSFRVSLEVLGERYAAIPEAALSWGATGAFVWLARNQQASRVGVQVQQRLRGRILVSGELFEGDTLIVEGIQSLRDGQMLDIQNPNDSATRSDSTEDNTRISS